MLEYEIPPGREFHDILHDSSPAVGPEGHQCFLSRGGQLIGLVLDYFSHNLSNQGYAYRLIACKYNDKSNSLVSL